MDVVRAEHYSDMVSRNLGLVTEDEQERLRTTWVFIPGLGGYGGACLHTLVRSGVTRFIVADIDTFETSNLNRQVFSSRTNVGCDKVESTLDKVRDINPDVETKTFGAEWVDQLGEILAECKIVANGMDDLEAAIKLYRKARDHGATVVDGYTAPLPSVFRVGPLDPRPEERLRYPTVGSDPTAYSEEIRSACKLAEIEYVMTHSSSVKHVDMSKAAEFLSGEAIRPSFAPTVITTGNLMAFEVISIILDRPTATDCRGYFLNPSEARVERPRNPIVARFVGYFVRRLIRNMTRGA